IERRRVAERLASGHPVVEARLLPEEADRSLVGLTGLERDTGDGRRATGRLGEPRQDLEGRGLPGAVGSEEAVDRAGRHLEVEVRQGLDSRVVLGQTGSADR